MSGDHNPPIVAELRNLWAAGAAAGVWTGDHFTDWESFATTQGWSDQKILEAKVVMAQWQQENAERAGIEFMDRVLPIIERHNRVVAGASAGGRARKRRPSDDLLRAEVSTLHTRNPRLSWTAVCERVAKQVGLSRRTVAARAAAADWRTK